MADEKDPQTAAPGDPQPSLGKSGKAATAGGKEQEEADKAAADAAQAQAKAVEKQEAARAKVQEAAQKDVEEAKKNALDKDGNVKTNDAGQVIGLDGKNPVSNNNPDPRTVQGTRAY